MKLAARAALVGLIALAPLPPVGADQGSGIGMLNAAQVGSRDGRQCYPRIVSTQGGSQGPRASQSLLSPGNLNCVEARYRGELEVEVELCDGRPVMLRGIAVERSAFANGREKTFGAHLTYQLVYDGETRSPPQSFRGGNRYRTAAFAPQRVTHAIVTLQSRHTPGPPIAQRLCSISFDMQPAHSESGLD
jgi:hypothetical protein